MLGWDSLADNDFFVVEYRVVNAGNDTYDSLNLGLYFDWDIQGKSGNRLQYDPSTGIAYAFNINHNNLYAGMALLTAGDTTFYALDLTSANGHQADFNNIFADSLKRAISAGGFEKTQAGHLAGGNNIASLMGLRNMELAAGQQKKVAFVIMAAESPGKLEELLSRARNYYHEYRQSPPYLATFPICAGEMAEIQLDELAPFEIYSDPLLVDLLDSGQAFTTGSLWEDTVFYVSRIVEGVREDARRVHVQVKEPIASFTSYTDTLLISPLTLDTITFYSTADDIDTYFWDFGNGYYSTVASPKVQYEQAGEYLVKLAVQNAIGCSDSTEKWLFVAERSAMPIVSGQVICKGEQAVLAAENTSAISVYASPMLQNRLYSGEAYATGALHTTSTYYVTNRDGFESLPVAVEVKVSHPQLSYQRHIDTTTLSPKYLLSLENTSPTDQTLSWRVNDNEIAGHFHQLDYAGVSDITVQIFGMDSLGCRDTLRHTIIPLVSPPAEVTNAEICVGEVVEIQPAGGDNFFFYRDEQLTQLVHKGSSLKVGPVRSDTSFYVTNVDSLLEGSPSKVQLLLKPLRAVIGMTPDSLNLRANSHAYFEDLSVGATQSFWIMPNGVVDARESFEMTIEEAGEYVFRLVARDDGSCVDTAHATLRAHVISGTQDFEMSAVRVFPNPAAESLNIYSPDAVIRQIELLDQSGKLLVWQVYGRSGPHRTLIELDSIPNGIYLLKVHTRGAVQVQKVVVRR